MNKDNTNDNKKDNTKEEIQKAYVYLVKIPSSNDLVVCASNSVFHPADKVILPTRYGLDLGLVVGSAANLGKNYHKGCSSCRGACHFEPTKPVQCEDDDVIATGYVESDTVIYESNDQRLTLGPLPKFEFIKENFSQNEDNEEESTNKNTEDSKDPEGTWDPAYKEPELMEVDGDAEWIAHQATEEEIQQYEINKDMEQDAIKICKEKIEKLKLNMKLVASHFLLCEPKVLFFFTADERVDFRELVKELVSVFRMRIELRQIGVRDESRVLGGLAVCGRDFCCHCVSDKLNPVTIKMAKEQNLSLNSMKISGPCGRLLCCLYYEYDFYCEEKQAYPPEGAKIKLGNEIFRVQEVNILSHVMTLTGSEGRSYTVPREEVYFDSDTGHWEVDKAYQDELLSN